jgi:hypothetical protein
MALLGYGLMRDEKSDPGPAEPSLLAVIVGSVALVLTLVCGLTLGMAQRPIPFARLLKKFTVHFVIEKGLGPSVRRSLTRFSSKSASKTAATRRVSARSNLFAANRHRLWLQARLLRKNRPNHKEFFASGVSGGPLAGWSETAKSGVGVVHGRTDQQSDRRSPQIPPKKPHHFIGNNETTAAKMSSAGMENRTISETRLSMTASINLVLAVY